MPCEELESAGWVFICLASFHAAFFLSLFLKQSALKREAVEESVAKLMASKNTDGQLLFKVSAHAKLHGKVDQLMRQTRHERLEAAPDDMMATGLV